MYLTGIMIFQTPLNVKHCLPTYTFDPMSASICTTEGNCHILYNSKIFLAETDLNKLNFGGDPSRTNFD